MPYYLVWIPIVIALATACMSLWAVSRATTQARMSRAAAQDFCKAAGDMGHIMGRYVVDERGKSALSSWNDRMEFYMKQYADVVGQ